MLSTHKTITKYPRKQKIELGVLKWREDKIRILGWNKVGG